MSEADAGARTQPPRNTDRHGAMSRLLDRPLDDEDVRVATLRVETLMDKLAKEYTIVIVTHNMQQAARVSHRVGFFWLGELIEYDLTPQLFTRPAQSLTEDYVTGRRG